MNQVHWDECIMAAGHSGALRIQATCRCLRRACRASMRFWHALELVLVLLSQAACPTVLGAASSVRKHAPLAS